MKIVLKRIVIAVVLCLAVVGAYTILKKAPQLDVSLEDSDYIETITGSKLQSGKATDSGLSGLLNDSLGNVPPVGGDFSTGSSAPPSSFGMATAAPPYGSAVSEAPAFGAATSEAPAFAATATSEAPAFLPVAIPIQEATPAPAFGSQYEAPPATPAPAVPPVPPAPTPSASPEPIASPPLAASPPYWDGPTSSITPSLAVNGPRGDFGVSGPSVSAESTTSNSLRDPWDMPTALTTTEAYSSHEVSSPTPPAIAAVNGSGDARINVENAPKFVKPQIKRLPVAEDPVVPAQIARQAPPESVVHATEQVIPSDYRPTSVRNTMVQAPLRQASEDDIPKISFAPGEKIEQAIESPKLESPSLPMPPVTETVPTTVAVAAPIAAPIATPVTAPMEASNHEVRETVARFVESQRQAALSGNPEKMKNAYIQLSKLYDRPELNEAEKNQLTPILDRLALDIIFSCKNHILETPYVVKAGDTIDSIASAHQISAALLMKINGLTGARPLKPGSELKVVFGQFDAKISAKRGELVLILGGLYAGRFPMTSGRDIANVRGEFVISSKSDSFKGKAITLSNGITILGADRPATDGTHAASFCLADRNINELYDILTERSVIVLEE